MPGVLPAGKVSLSLWKIASLRGEYLIGIVISHVVSSASFINLDFSVTSSQVESMAIEMCVYCSRFKVRYPLSNSTFGTARGACPMITLPTEFLVGQIYFDENISDGCCKHGYIDRCNVIETNEFFMDLKLLGDSTEN